MSKDANDSLTSNEAVETNSSPEIPTLSSWNDNFLTSIEAVEKCSRAVTVAIEPGCSLMAPLPPPRESSCTSYQADEGSCISQLTLSAPLHGADSGHTAMAQPDLMLLDAFEPQIVQETLDCVVPRRKAEKEVGLPVCGVEPLQECSVPQMPQHPSEPDVEVRKPLVLDEAVKRQLERHLVKLQIQRCFGRPEKVLASYKKLSEPVWELPGGHPPPQRHTVPPYRSSFQKFFINTRKNLFTVRVIKHSDRLSREVVECPSLEMFKTSLNTLLCELL